MRHRKIEIVSGNFNQTVDANLKQEQSAKSGIMSIGQRARETIGTAADRYGGILVLSEC